MPRADDVRMVLLLKRRAPEIDQPDLGALEYPLRPRLQPALHTPVSQYQLDSTAGIGEGGGRGVGRGRGERRDCLVLKQ